MLSNLAEYRDFAGYKSDVRKSVEKLKEKPVPYRLIREFAFDKDKGPLLIIGKPDGPLLKDLKAEKIKAEGYVRVVTRKLKETDSKEQEVVEFQVDKGSLAPNDLTTAFKDVGLTQPARMVDDVSGTPMKAPAGPDREALKKRAQALAERFKKLKEPPQELGKAIGLLEGQIKEAEDPETLVDKVEEALVGIERGRAPISAEQVDKHLKEKPGGDRGGHRPDVALDEALDTVTEKLTALEERFDALLKDPNGLLLAGKQVQALGAAVEGITRKLKSLNPSLTERHLAAAEDARKRLKLLSGKLPELSPKELEAYVQSRRDELGWDKGNKKPMPQEGEVGSDVEMQLGGLKRSESAEVEFEPGDFSPYKDTKEAKQPKQFDVFGLTPDVTKKVMCLHARKSYGGLKVVTDDDELWEHLRVLKAAADVQVKPLMTAPVHVVPQVVFDSYLRDGENSKKSRSFFQSLEEHFAKGKEGQKKTTIVPLDARGLARWPALLDYVKADVTRRFPALKHLIVWRE